MHKNVRTSQNISDSKHISEFGDVPELDRRYLLENIALVACEAGKPFAEKIVFYINKKYNASLVLAESKETHFANGEIKFWVKREDITGKNVFVVQDIASRFTAYTINDNIMALFFALNAIMWNDDIVSSVTAIVPNFPAERQHNPAEGESDTLMLTARFLEDSGADDVVTIDVHNLDAIVEAFSGLRCAFHNICVSGTIINYLKANYAASSKLVIASLDEGGKPLASHYAGQLGIPCVFGRKERDYSSANIVNKVVFDEPLQGTVLIVDDMIDTGSSLKRAIQSIRAGHNDVEGVIVACTSAYFNKSAEDMFRELYFDDGFLKKVIGTDAVSHTPEFLKANNEWYIELNVAHLFGDWILEHIKELCYGFVPFNNHQ